MSLLRNEEFAIYRLRTGYLANIKDGVGERLITVNPGVLNTSGFRAAGWYANPADIKRTYSPPIPTASVASEYFQRPPGSAGLHAPSSFGEEDEEGGIVTGGGGSNDTVGPAVGTAAKRRRRRREQMEEDDSSDLSDDSDEEADDGKALQSIRFAKMPVRTRSGSSPIKGTEPKEGPSVLVTSPSKPPDDNRLRRGSLGAVEAVKARARRDTATSSELSSENELDPSVFKRKQINPIGAVTASRALAERLTRNGRKLPPPIRQESTDLEDEVDDEEDSGDDSDGTALSSDFAETADSTSMVLGAVTDGLTASPINELPTTARPPDVGESPKKSRSGPSILPKLPPARPISVLQPVSALSMAIKAKRSKAATPFERFAILAGKADPNPVRLRIYAPFSKSPSKPFEVIIKRTTHAEEGGERKVTVADAIGFSLWRFYEEKMAPPISDDRLNVNWWTLRMVEDDEVDYDFPALERVKSMEAFASNNNRPVRARSNSKPFDEFALVEATEEQFKQNEELTPNFKQEAATSSETLSDDISLTPQPVPSPAPPGFRRNILGYDPNNAAFRSTNSNPADAPAPTIHSTQRSGSSKILRIHLDSPEGFSQLVSVDVTTDTYMAEVLDLVCKKRNLDKAQYVLKVSGTRVVIPLDRTVEALGERADLDLQKRRFGNDGPPTISGSPSSTSPNAPLLVDPAALIASGRRPKPSKKGSSTLALPTSIHPLSHSTAENAPLNLSNYKTYIVWRKQPMSFMPTHERTMLIDGEYLRIMPVATGKSTIFDSGSKPSVFHFAHIVGAKSSKKHPSNFKVLIFKARETKRYDFEAQNAEEAAEIVKEIKKRIQIHQGP